MSNTQAASNIIDAPSLRAAREIAYDEFRKTQSVRKLTKQLSKLSDQLLSHLWIGCGINNEATTNP